ncbi:flagellar biosynthesis anti-sigma factor FlgM [Enterobacteriaceae bacterium C23F]
MSIDSTKPTAPVTALASNQEMRTRTAPQENSHLAAVEPQNKTEVTLSTLTKRIQNDDSRDVDYARVAEIRAALEAGELPLDPEKIAGALVQDMFQFH